MTTAAAFASDIYMCTPQKLKDKPNGANPRYHMNIARLEQSNSQLTTQFSMGARSLATATLETFIISKEFFAT